MHSGRYRQIDEEQHPHDRSKNSGTQTMENTHVCTTFHFHGKQIKRIFIKLELLTNNLAIKQSIEKLISRVVYHEGGLDFRYVE